MCLIYHEYFTLCINWFVHGMLNPRRWSRSGKTQMKSDIECDSLDYFIWVDHADTEQDAYPSLEVQGSAIVGKESMACSGQKCYVFQSQSCGRYEHLVSCTVIRTRSIQAVLLWIIQVSLTKLHFLFIWRPNFVWNFSSYTKHQDVRHIFGCSFKCHIISISDPRKGRFINLYNTAK